MILIFANGICEIAAIALIITKIAVEEFVKFSIHFADQFESMLDSCEDNYINQLRTNDSYARLLLRIKYTGMYIIERKTPKWEMIIQWKRGIDVSVSTETK